MEQCCQSQCDFTVGRVKQILRHIRDCRGVGVDPVIAAHSGLSERDDAPVWSGMARDFGPGTGSDDDVLAVVAVMTALDAGARTARAVARWCCPDAERHPQV